MRRKYLFTGQALILLIVVTTLYFEGHHLAQFRPLRPLADSPAGNVTDEVTVEQDTLPENSTSQDPPANVTRFVKAIFNPDLHDPPRLECPQIAGSLRYAYLKNEAPPQQGERRDPVDVTEIDYFFAIDLRDVLDLLPRLLGSVIEVIRFLGPTRCALSIIEGNSHDGTLAVLDALRPDLDALTTTYYLRSSDIDPQQGDRIAKLAELRNMAIKPLMEEPYSGNTTVVFLNDVAACPEDILELVHQRQALGADMTCGLDWVYVGADPTFYDVWVARGMTGDSFFHIPDDGNWNSAWNLFWNDPDAHAAVAGHRPFQVFACWNGATVFTAQPIVDGSIQFRGPKEGECKQGEPQLFCKDMWFHGYGKIAVVPSVNLEYSDGQARKIKELKGYTSQYASADAQASSDEAKIDWKAEPPESVKCMPSYDTQSFRPWNEALGSAR